MAFVNPLNTTNSRIDILSGTGPISIGADSASKVITLGSDFGSSSLVLLAGSAGISLTAQEGPIAIASNNNAVSLNSTIAVNIATNANDNRPVNIGTAGANCDINIGNSGVGGVLTLTSEQVSLSASGLGLSLSSSGTFGTLSLQSSAALSLESSSAINIAATANNGVNIATASFSGNVNLGNATAGNTLKIDSATVQLSSLGAEGLVVSTNTAGALSRVGYGTLNQVLTSNGPGVAPSFKDSPVEFSWVVTDSSGDMVLRTGYITTNDGSRVTLVLPADPTPGTIVAVQGYGNAGWRISQRPGQNTSILFNGAASTTNDSGFLQSGSRYDSVYLIYIGFIANTHFWAYNSGFGNYDIQ